MVQETEMQKQEFYGDIDINSFTEQTYKMKSGSLQSNTTGKWDP